MNCINKGRVEVWYDPTRSGCGRAGLDKDGYPEMKRPIYLAGKDAEYHILRISINRFTKVLEGLRVNDPGKRHEYYLDFCSGFLVDLWLLVSHGSDIANTVTILCTRPRKQNTCNCHCLRIQGWNPNPNLERLSRMRRPAIVPLPSPLSAAFGALKPHVAVSKL
jgi:hypothetical protein